MLAVFVIAVADVAGAVEEQLGMRSGQAQPSWSSLIKYLAKRLLLLLLLVVVVVVPPMRRLAATVEEQHRKQPGQVTDPSNLA
jgi:hypothetical protein